MSDNFGHNPFDKVTLPDAQDGTFSRTFSVPKGAKVLTIHVPTLVGATTLAIQSADPRDGDKDALVWRNLSAVVITATIGFCSLATIPEEAATTIPVAALGGGVLRYVASNAQTGAPDAITIRHTWGQDG